MNFTSYAPNFEDVMLWRVLKHIHPGFYIDINEKNPDIDSISKGFYEQHWRGVHVTPAQYCTNLKVNRPGEAIFALVTNRQNSFIAQESANDIVSNAESSIEATWYRQSHSREEGQLITLDRLLDSIKAPDIHWLRINLEGDLDDILAGWQSQIPLPWVIIIKNNILAQPILALSPPQWEPFLLAKGYQFAYFDGVNRFYIAANHPELMPAFNAPSNEFAFSSQSMQSLYGADKAEPTERYLSGYNSRLPPSNQIATQASIGRGSLDEQRLNSLYKRWSWSIIVPLWCLIKKSKSIFVIASSNRFKLRLKRFAKNLIRRIGQYCLQHSRLKRLVVSSLDPYPVLKQRLKIIIAPWLANGKTTPLSLQDEFETLSPRAQYLYRALHTFQKK